MLKEFDKHRNYIIKKSKLSKEDLELALDLVSSTIRFIPFSEFRQFIKKSKEISPDPNDMEYLALALKLNLPIWSNDKQLKRQKVVEIFSTTELLRKFGL